MENYKNSLDNKYLRAKEKVEKLRGFYRHLCVYVIFCIFFIGLNILGGSSYPWAIFPIAGWGIGVLGHASDALDFHILFGRNWEERKIKELMDEEESIRF